MRNTEFEETLWVGDALRNVAALLPTSWRLESLAETLTGGQRADPLVTLTGPSAASNRPEQSITFLVEAKRSGTPTGLLLASLREQALATNRPLLFVSDYLGPSLREALNAAGISYADATGWVRIASDAPLILLTGQGAAKSSRAGRPTAVARLNGVAASRIIRTLCSEDTPLGVRELAALADVSPGSVSKLLPTLARESIIDRDNFGAVISVRRRALIQRWVRDYSYAKSNGPVGYFIAPRGLDRTLKRLTDLPAAVTLTGSAAARRLLPEGTTSVVPLRLLALYADAPSELVAELGLVPADPVTANTVIAGPQDGGVLTEDVAPVALVLADLLTLPARGDAEAEQLMDALARGDEAWEA